MVGKVFVGLGVRLRDEGEGRGVRVSRDEDEPLDKVSNLSGLADMLKKMDSQEPSCGSEVRDKGLVLPDSDDLVVDDTPGSNDKGNYIFIFFAVSVFHLLVFFLPICTPKSCADTE